MPHVLVIRSVSGCDLVSIILSQVHNCTSLEVNTQILDNEDDKRPEPVSERRVKLFDNLIAAISSSLIHVSSIISYTKVIL